MTITIDVHESDPPRALDRCSDHLSERDIAATFFVPTALLDQHSLTASLRRLGGTPHAIGSHGHRHDRDEQLALRSAHGLGFLTESHERFEQFYGRPADLFRSPCWCELSAAAFDVLAALGYRVDCSSTPGRPGLLSSDPLTSPWLRSSRHPYFVCGSLLEVPTSCLLLPLAAPTFLTLRRRASVALSRLLAWEAGMRPGMVVNVMFHAADFLDDWCYGRLPFAMRDVVPRADGGFTWRRFLQSSDPEQILACVDAVIDSLGSVTSLREIYDRHAAVHEPLPAHCG